MLYLHFIIWFLVCGLLGFAYARIIGSDRKRRLAENKLETACYDLEMQIEERTAELTKSKQDWEGIFNSLSTPIQIIDPAHGIIQVNDATLKTFGLKEEELIGKKCFEIFHNSDKPQMFCPLEAAIKERKVVSEEMVVETYNRHFIISCAPLFDADGNIEKFSHVMTDITDRKNAEEKIDSQNQLLNAIINSSNDIIIFSLDNNYCYTTFNELHKREMKLVWNADIEGGMNLLDVMVIPETRELAKLSIDRALNGESFTEIQHQPNTEIYYELTWNPIFAGHNVSGVTAFVVDITKRKNTEAELDSYINRLEGLFKERTAELEEANRELKELDRLKSLFIASMSHELRTPLNSIIGFSGILLMGMAGELNPEQKKQLSYGSG